MILLIALQDDPHADFVVKGFNDLGYKKFFRLNSDTLSDYDVVISDKKSSIKCIETGKSLKLEEVKSVWVRRRGNTQKNIDSSEIQLNFIQYQWRSFLVNMFFVLKDIFWLSSPEKIDAAGNKMKQLLLAKRVGFSIPDTLFTNSKEAILNFYPGDKIIMKPHTSTQTGQGRVMYTNVVKHKDIQELDHVQVNVCPLITQLYIEKEFEIRVTVVGEEVFAAKINSQDSDISKIDWRKYDFENVSFVAYDLPADISERCILLTKELGLSFGAIDLIVTPGGQYVFLEINPNGQWAWIECLAKLPISQAIAKLLISHD